MKIAVHHKIQTGFAVALAFLLLAGTIVWRSARQNAETYRAVEHTYQVLNRLDAVLTALLNTETGSRGFAISGDEAFMRPHQEGIAAVQESLQAAQRMTQDNPAQQRRLAALDVLIRKKLRHEDDVIKSRRNGDSTKALEAIASGIGQQTMDEIRKSIGEVTKEEERLLIVRTVEAQRLASTPILIGVIGSLIAIGLVSLSMIVVRRDFEKRHQAEAERDRFFTLSPDLLCIASADGHFKRVNPAFAATLGRTVGDYVTRPFIDFVHPDDRAATLREVERQVVSGEPTLRFVNRYQHEDGSWRWLSWKSVPAPDGFMYATARDITALQQADDALRRSEESLSVTLNSIGDAVLATDTEGCVTRLNPVAERLTGWTQSEALGRPVAEVFQIVNEETRLPSVIPVDKVLSTGEVHGLANHTIVIARDGTERPIADSAAPIRDKDGRILGVVLVFRDVTEEKKAEEEIRRFTHELEDLVRKRTAEMHETGRLARATLDALTAHVAILDERGIILATNRTWRDFAVKNGLLPSQADVGTSYLDACASGAEAMAHGIREVIAGRKREFSLEYDCHSPVEKRWFLCRVTRFPDDGAVRVVIAHEDITQMKLLERRQMRSQRLEAIGTMAGGVAHDLNNALAPILMGMELLKLQYPQESETFNLFERSAHRGANMVRQLLTFAKGTTGDHTPLQPRHLIEEMRDLIRASFPKNIEVVVRCEPELPTVLGDATQLHQVLLNLCVNARDAMPHGGTLTLEARRREVDAVYASSVPDAKPGHYVMLRVRDTGSGIAPDLIDRIFEPFFTTKGPDQGTGLGLSTAFGIVKGHGGFLQVYSQLDQGAAFTLYLPADLPASDTEHLAKAVVEFRGQGESILFVDDEFAVREVARAVLQRLNFRPLIADDGLDGLVKATEHRAELRAVITDLHMPKMDGLQFVRSLLQTFPEIPVVVASGRMEDTVAAEFKALGVTSRLDKPFTEAQLATALKEALAAHEG